MTIKNIKGVRTLCQGNNPVQSVTIEEALRDFLRFITQVKNSDQHNNPVTVLIGHNSATFDVPILLRNGDKNFKDSITDMNVYFAHSPIYMYRVLPYLTGFPYLLGRKHRSLYMQKYSPRA